MEPSDDPRLSARRLDGDGQVRLIIAGELDISERRTAYDAIRGAEALSPPLLVLDLTGLEFIDSTGVGLLLEVEGRARAEGRTVRIVAGSVVAKVLDLAGIADYFDLVRRA
jgi:anti-anti-sigma factor